MKYNTIFIDLNSVFNTMFYDEIIKEINLERGVDSYVQSIGGMFKNSLTNIIGKNVTMLYTENESCFLQFCPEWKKAIRKRWSSISAKKIFNYFIK